MADLAASSESTFMLRHVCDDAEHAYQEHLFALQKGTHSVFHPRCLNDHHHRPPNHNFHPHPCPALHGQQQLHHNFQPGHPHPRQPPPQLQHPSHHGSGSKSSIASEIAKAREHIRHTLNGLDGEGSIRFEEIVKDNIELKKRMSELESVVNQLTKKIESLEKLSSIVTSASSSSSSQPQTESEQPTSTDKKETEDAEDDFELFGSDEEQDEEAERVKQERLKAYEEKKSKKPQLIAKSNIILDVKPWDDETDMKKLEECVRSIEMEGLLWGASKLVPLAYGIKKLQISCVVEDDKVSTEDLEEKILEFEDYIQSMDIAAFNKI